MHASRVSLYCDTVAFGHPFLVERNKDGYQVCWPETAAEMGQSRQSQERHEDE